MNKDDREKAEKQRQADEAKRHADNARAKKYADAKADHRREIDRKALDGCKNTAMIVMGLLVTLAAVVTLLALT